MELRLPHISAVGGRSLARVGAIRLWRGTKKREVDGLGAGVTQKEKTSQAGFGKLKRGGRIGKVIKVISAIAVCVLGVAVFAPQAKADAAPSGALIYNCGPCGGSVLANGSGGFVGNISIPLTFASNTNGGDEVGETSTLIFDTSLGTISLNDGTDFSLAGTIFNVSVTPPDLLGESKITFDASFAAIGPGNGYGAFVVTVTAPLGPLGPVENARVRLVSPEPTLPLLLGPGL